MKYVGFGVVGLLGIILLMIIGSGLGVLGNFLGIGEEVTDTQRMVGEYEEFFEKCSSYNTLIRQEENLQAQLEEAPEEEKSRVRSSITGVQGQQARVAEEYDANAADRTRSWLRDNDLPERLTPHLENSETAECR